MKADELINKKISIAEKRILELINSGDLKKLPESVAYNIAKFYEIKSINRLETARIVYDVSKNIEKKKLNKITGDYSDYSEAAAAAYYAMYYIIHAYLAKNHVTQLREGVRDVHAITQQIILYYLVKTKKLVDHLYREYMKTFETTAQIQKLGVEDFQEKACRYAEKYDKSRAAREVFTYNVVPSAEAHHADHAIKVAEEFISIIRQLMIQR